MLYGDGIGPPHPQPHRFSKQVFLSSLSLSCIGLHWLAGALAGAGGSYSIGQAAIVGAIILYYIIIATTYLSLSLYMYIYIYTHNNVLSYYIIL